MVREDAMHGNYERDPFNYKHFNLEEFSLKVGSEDVPVHKLKCNMDGNSNDILRPLFSVLLANHSLFSNEELGINPSNYRNRNVFFLAWDLSQMPPGQSFEMAQEKLLSLILKLRRANNFVINVIVHCEYNSEIEILNNRQVICHEYALKNMQEANKISLPHHQGSFSDEYNNRKINIDFNEILHSEINDSLARNKKYEIQIECVTEIHMVIPNTIHYASQYPIHHVPKHKQRPGN